MTEFGLL